MEIQGPNMGCGVLDWPGEKVGHKVATQHIVRVPHIHFTSNKEAPCDADHVQFGGHCTSCEFNCITNSNTNVNFCK